jgi:centrosomal protein CEP164
MTIRMSARQTILEEELPEGYEPTKAEILEYAKWLGMDIETEQDLFWIARDGLKAPLPKDWKPCKTEDGEIYYFNFASGESVWDHPCDEYYRKVNRT